MENMDFLERMKDECKQLDEKLEKLIKFIKSDKFKTLTDYEQFKLIEQRVYMTGYCETLRARIEYELNKRYCNGIAIPTCD